MTKTEAILAAISANPGLTAADIAARARLEGLTTKQTASLALHLSRAGKCSRKRIDGIWRYHPPGLDVMPAAVNVRVGGAAHEGRQVAQEAVTADWIVIALRDSSVVLTHKDTNCGFRLDAETVAAIRRMG